MDGEHGKDRAIVYIIENVSLLLHSLKLIIRCVLCEGFLIDFPLSFPIIAGLYIVGSRTPHGDLDKVHSYFRILL